tara:strand:+ start:717 stop:1223 length:507 start_codon:yes stop_codon:yes gene_type:complete
MSLTETLSREAEAARSLLANIRDVIGDDEDAAADAVEGQTGFKEAVIRVTERLAEIEAIAEAIATRRERLGARSARLTAQSEAIRTALSAALDHAGVKRIELPSATISLKATPPKIIVTDEAAIPTEFWKRGDPKLDRGSLLKALKDEREIPGAALSNGGITIQIREG